MCLSDVFCVSDRCQHSADFYDLPFVAMKFFDLSGVRRVQGEYGFIRLNLDQFLILLYPVAFFYQPADDFAFRNSFAHIRKFEFSQHGRLR